MAFEFTDDNFQESALDVNGLVLVDFWAPWCGPCRLVGPIIDDLSKELEGTVRVGKVNVDDHQNTSVKYGIRSIPTILLLKNGEVVDKHTGTATKQQLMEKINAHLS